MATGRHEMLRVELVSLLPHGVFAANDHVLHKSLYLGLCFSLIVHVKGYLVEAEAIGNLIVARLFDQIEGGFRV